MDLTHNEVTVQGYQRACPGSIIWSLLFIES